MTYPELWPRLLDEVWSAVRPRRTEIQPGRNVMLSKDDVPSVEVGVEIDGLFAPLGRIVASTLPAGRVAMTTHRGSWDVGPAHRAVIDECERLGLERVGPRWEIDLRPLQRTGRRRGRDPLPPTLNHVAQ